MVTEITYDEASERCGYRRGFAFAFPPGKSADLFFEINGDQTASIAGHDCVGDYLEQVQRGPMPRGIHMVKSLDNGRYFLLVCDKDRHDEAVKFARSLFKQANH